MRIDDLSVNLRARNPWEAFDLGVALARHTGANLYLAFALPFLACMLLINIVGWDYPVGSMLVFWWLKPAFDRIALHVLGQAVFGATPSWRTTLKSLWQIPRTGLLYALTFGRFDFARSFHLPVFQLEGQTGKARRERLAVLDRTARSQAVWLTVVIIHFGYILLLGVNGLLEMFSPPGMHFSLHLEQLFSSTAEVSLLAQHLFNAAFAVSECLLEPLYIASGFSLYLSRRTVLEGWDLELEFKRMTERIAAAGSAMARMAVLLLAVGVLHIATGNEALAQAAADPAKADTGVTASALDRTPTSAAPSPEKQAITEILNGADFNQYEERKEWRRRVPEAAKPKPSEFWILFAQLLGEALRLAAWVAAIGFIGWLLFFLAQRLGWFREIVSKRRGGYKPEVLFGLDLRPESLPDDIPAAARALIAQGEMRAALSLMYRGALRVLIHERELDVRDGDTESDCVRRVNRMVPAAPAAYFRQLVDAWGLIAYGRRVPPPALAQKLVEEWAQHFAPPSESVPA